MTDYRHCSLCGSDTSAEGSCIDGVVYCTPCRRGENPVRLELTSPSGSLEVDPQ